MASHLRRLHTSLTHISEVRDRWLGDKPKGSFIIVAPSFTFILPFKARWLFYVQQQQKIQKIYFRPTQCVCVFCMHHLTREAMYKVVKI